MSLKLLSSVGVKYPGLVVLLNWFHEFEERILKYVPSPRPTTPAVTSPTPTLFCQLHPSSGTYPTVVGSGWAGGAVGRGRDSWGGAPGAIETGGEGAGS